MKKISQSKFYILLFIAAAIIFFAVLYNIEKTSKVETDVLVIPRSDMTSKNIDQITASMIEIPKSLSFYNAVISEKSDILKDDLSGLPDYQRKDRWGSMIQAEKIDGSSIIRISVFDSNPSRAESLSRQSALELAKSMSRFYNIKTELDVRIIDGPIAKTGTRDNVLIIVSESVLLALAALILIFTLNKAFELIFPARKKEAIRFVESPLQVSHESAATSAFSLDQKKVKDLEAAAEEVASNKPKTKTMAREATAEEAKERLSRLLRGEY
jgi:capsular polysaccharide biosynthesis protein